MRYLTMFVLVMFLLGCGDGVKSKASEETESASENGVTQQEEPVTGKSNEGGGEGIPQPDIETGENEEASNQGEEAPEAEQEPLDYHEMTIEEIFYSGTADIGIYPVKEDEESWTNFGMFAFFKDGSTYFGHSYIRLENVKVKFVNGSLIINYEAMGAADRYYIRLKVSREKIVTALDEKLDEQEVVRIQVEPTILKKEKLKKEEQAPLL